MTTKIQKWGNSLAIRLPKQIAADAGFLENATVEISNENNSIKLVLKKVVKNKKYSLKELVSKINDGNRRGEYDWGAPKGKEVW